MRVLHFSTTLVSLNATTFYVKFEESSWKEFFCRIVLLNNKYNFLTQCDIWKQNTVDFIQSTKSSRKIYPLLKVIIFRAIIYKNLLYSINNDIELFLQVFAIS